MLIRHRACANGVPRVCLFCQLFVFPACCFSVFLLSVCLVLVCSLSVCLLSVCLLSVCLQSVCLLLVLALFVFQAPPPPFLPRGNVVCPLWVSCFNIICWMFRGHTVLDYGYLLDSMFAPFSINLASLLRASFSH